MNKVVEFIVLALLLVASYFAIIKISFEFVLFAWVVITFLVLLWNRYFNEERVPKEKLGEEPEIWPVDFSRSFFPVLLIVFMLRSFVAEPFQIPSGSMLPSLEVGDFILVNKFAYGVRLPIVHKKVVTNNEPKRGDVMVFRYPRDNKTNYIKRVIGLPGDTIEYRFKQLYINGKQVDIKQQTDYSALANNGERVKVDRFVESLQDINHDILLNLNSGTSGFYDKKWQVPEGQYFVMGDNRDNSQDSRVWGFVPDKNVVGKAFFIWFHWNRGPGGGFNLSRIGTNI